MSGDRFASHSMVGPFNRRSEHDQGVSLAFFSRKVIMIETLSRPCAAEDSRLRRLAKKSGYALRRSRSRIYSINNRGEYQIVDPFLNAIVAGEKYDLTASDVQDWLKS